MPVTAIKVAAKTGNTTPNLPPAYTVTDANSVSVWQPLQPFTDEALVTRADRLATEVSKSVQYIDGLGRLAQTVGWKASPNQKDVVAPVVYDDFGREQYKYLPYEAATADGTFKTDPFNDQKTFYGTTYPNEQPAFTGEQFYYSHTQPEASPLGRPVKIFAPGNSWAGSEGGTAEKAVAMQYLITNGNDHVRIWDIAFAAFADNANIPTSLSAREYTPGELYKTVTLDEQNNSVVEYKDKEGHVVLKKVQIGTIAADYSGYSGFLSTFYVYDDMGQLRFVIPPKAVAQMIAAGNWTLTTPVINELCFRYEYDERQRMKAKKVPGAAWVYMVYDKRDRLCFTQDGNLRGKQQWMYTLYDNLNRPLETGIITYTGTWDNLITAAAAATETPVAKSTTGTYVNTAPADLVVTERDFTIALYTATNSIELRDEFSSENNAEFVAQISAQAAGTFSATETVNMVAALTGATWYPLTYTYYDNYSFGTTKSYSTANNSQLNDGGGNATATLEALPSTASAMTTGLVTGTRVRVIENPANLSLGGWLETVSYYDDDGRAVQVQSDNYKGGKDIATTRYNFTNKAVCTYLAHTNPAGGKDGANGIGVKTSVLYDHVGRVVKTTKQVTYQGTTYSRTTAQNVYDALGQLKNKKIGQKSATDVTEMENDQYAYNIRGWLKGVNYYNGTSYASQVNNSGNKWFAFDLSYDWGMSANQFNGNIGGMRWESSGDNKERAYGYGYDPANRLLKADFTQYNSSWGADPVLNFNVKMGDGTDPASAYDENGNIKRMQQWGLAGTASQQVDDLAYTYASGGVSNKLLGVKDNGVQPAINLGDFNDKNATGNDYGYDVNGNLVSDRNKRLNGVTDIDQTTAGAIVYNHLNLPWQVSVSNDDGSAKGTITYIYDAVGNKLEKRVVEGTKQTQTAYVNGFVYENNKLQFLPQEEGRVRFKQSVDPATGQALTAFVYDYFLKDHLGNVRMVLTDEQKTDVYPALSFEGVAGSAEVANQSAIWEKADGTAFDVTGKRTSQANMQGYAGTPSPFTYCLQVRSSTGKVGSAKLVKVMAGDKINSTVQYYYAENTGSGSATGLNTLIAGLASVLTNSMAAPAGLKASASAVSNAVSVDPNASAFFAPQSSSNNNGRPKAFLNVLFFDEQFKFDASASYFQQIKTTSANNPGQEVVINKTALTNGYCYVYISNETNDLVYFDNLTLSHERGRLTEETHYYPFGLTMSGISSKAAGGLINKKGFNGNELQNKEFSDGSGLEMYDFNARTYDPQIGRFIQIDPTPEDGEQEVFSLYHFSGNNPIRYSDPAGKCFPCLEAVVEVAVEIFTGEAAMAAGGAAAGTVAVKHPGLINRFIHEAVEANAEQILSTGAISQSIGFTGPSIRVFSKGSANPIVNKSREIGQEAHRQEQAKIKQNDKAAKIEKTITLKDGTVVRKDAIKSDGTPVIIKPDTKSGQASAKKREDLLIKNKEKKPEIILYDPKDPKYLPGSPTYIGPKK